MLNKTYGTKACSWCGEEFQAVKSNQIYCSPEHTRRASNQKIIDKYHATKKLRSTDRYCDSCGNKLSRYNEDPICNPCQQGKKEMARIEFLKELGFEYIDENLL